VTMHILATAALALAAAWILERLRVPSGSLLGPTIVVATVNLAADAKVSDLPAPVRFLAFAALGWSIGAAFTPQTLAILRSAAGPVLISVLLLLGAGGLLAWGLVTLTSIDPATAFLAASPGALSQMIAVSASTGADSPLVATMHLLRLFAVMVVSPFVVRFLPSG
jgi:membrane AbrB-like protein